MLSGPQARRRPQPSPLGPLPRQRRMAGLQVLAHNLARTARIGLDEGVVTTRPSGGETAHPLGPPPHFASATGLALGNPVHSRAGSIASPAIACLTAPTAPRPPGLPNRPTESTGPVRDCLPLQLSRRPRPSAAAQDRHRRPQRKGDRNRARKRSNPKAAL